MIVAILLIAPLFMIIVGVINPRIALFFIKNEDYHTRKLATGIWIAVLFAISLIVPKVTPPPVVARAGGPTVMEYIRLVDSLSFNNSPYTQIVLDSIAKNYPIALDTAVYILAQNIKYDYPDSSYAFLQYLVGKNILNPDERYSLETGKFLLELRDTATAINLLKVSKRKNNREAAQLLKMLTNNVIDKPLRPSSKTYQGQLKKKPVLPDSLNF